MRFLNGSFFRFFVLSVRKVEKVLPRGCHHRRALHRPWAGVGGQGEQRAHANNRRSPLPHRQFPPLHLQRGGGGTLPSARGIDFLVLNSLFFQKRNKILAFEKNVSLSGKRERGCRGGGGGGGGEGRVGLRPEMIKLFFFQLGSFFISLSLSLSLSLLNRHICARTHTHLLSKALSLSFSLSHCAKNKKTRGCRRVQLELEKKKLWISVVSCIFDLE